MADLNIFFCCAWSIPDPESIKASKTAGIYGRAAFFPAYCNGKAAGIAPRRSGVYRLFWFITDSG